MSAVCTCHDPVVVERPGHDAHCKRCGQWWMPKYGSMPMGIPRINLALKQQEAAAAKLGRNEPCFCGSGRKFKKCHGGAVKP